VFADANGRSLLSRTAVSEITERLWAEYEAFVSRDLSEFAVTYLFVDGIAERLHLGQPREAVLAAWGILSDGKKALLHLAPGTKEDTASCREFFHDLPHGSSQWAKGPRRGLPDLLLVAQRRGARDDPRHRGMSTALDSPALPGAQDEICKARCPKTSGRSSRRAPRPATRRPRQPWRACCATPYGQGPALGGGMSRRRLRGVHRHLRFPLGHRRVIRTTNLLERLFGEARRRTKIIPHAFGERAVLKLVYAALIRAAEHWRGIRITEFEQRQLRAIRDEIDKDFTARTAPAAGATVPRCPNPFIQQRPDLTVAPAEYAGAGLRSCRSKEPILRDHRGPERLISAGPRRRGTGWRACSKSTQR
jgi:hypothetical protein